MADPNVRPQSPVRVSDVDPAGPGYNDGPFGYASLPDRCQCAACQDAAFEPDVGGSAATRIGGLPKKKGGGDGLPRRHD